MAKLPQRLPLDQMATTWASALDPVLATPIIQGLLLEDVKLVTGANVVSHKLGRKLRGWMVTRVNAAVSIYDTQDANQMQALTLNLTSSGNATVSLWVF